jgi:hypothetical protein
MAVAFRAMATNAAISSPTSLTINKPTGTTTDDQMIVMLSLDSGGTITATGWTLLHTINSTDSDQTFGVYRRTVVSGDSGTTSFAFTFAGGTFEAAGAILTYSGVDTAAPVNQSSSRLHGSDVADPQSVPATSITPNTDNCMILYLGTVDLNGTATCAWTPHSGYAERVDYDGSAQGATGLAPIHASELLQTSAAATGTITAVCDNNNSRTGEPMAVLLALAPTGGGAPAGQPSGARFGGVPGMRIGGQTFGRGW